jgi:hypothetical protein
VSTEKMILSIFPLTQVEMVKATRKASKTTMKKGKKGTRKGKRTLSPALKAWNDKVMKKYREMKKADPSTRLGDAMKAAKKD